jgi:putative membrane protein
MKIKLVGLNAVQLVLPALALANDDQYGMWPGMMGWGHSMAWPMMIFMLLFWGVVLAVIIVLIRWIFFKGGHGVTLITETALDILKKRYAKGEIDKEEFEEKKQVLEE